MNSVLSPLLKRTSLLPGESLPSLLIRLAELNGYGLPNIINRLILSGTRENRRKHRAGRPALTETYKRIESLTRIPSIELHAATVHCFAPVVTPPCQDVASLTLPGGAYVPLLLQDEPEKSRTHPRLRTLRADEAAQFCPHCLQERSYHRLLWSLVAVSACCRHQCLLASSCHACGSPVSVQSIVTHICMKCQADLRATRAMLLSEDVFGLYAQQSIQAWLMGITAPPSELYTVAERPLNVLYQFVCGLQLAAADLAMAGSPCVHALDERPLSLSKTLHGISLTLTPYQSYCLYATTCKWLVNWPTGFHGFLDAYRLLASHSENHWSVSRMGRLSVIWRYDQNWQHPDLDFTREALTQYAFETGMPGPSHLKIADYVAQLERRNGITTASRASRLLQAPHVLIDRLLAIGLLEPYETRESVTARSRPLWLAEVLALYRAWQEAITLAETAQWLGITCRIIVDMVQMGLLTPVCAEGLSRVEESQWMFQRESVSDCLLRMVRYVSVTDIPSDTIDLLSVEMLHADELHAARALKYLTDGRLRGFSPRGTPWSLDSLRFKPSGIKVCADEDQVGREWASAEEVAMRMDMRGMKAWKAAVSRWVSAGLLTPVGADGVKHYFDRREVDAFVSRYVISKNIPRMFLLKPYEITRLMREGKLVPRSGLGIDRSPVNLFELQDLKNAVGIRIGEV